MIHTNSQQAKIHNLPSQPTSFIGRESEIADIVTQLREPECRLLTLVGPGGIGKTRLAIQVAERLPDYFEHGIYYVPLAPLNRANDIIHTIVTALGILSSDTRTPHQLLTYLSQRRLLLIIDNFEHVLDGTTLIADILHEAPDVNIMVTSRANLNLREEWVWRVRGLPYPKQIRIDQFESYSALQLFADRARRVQHDFSLQGQREDVIRICQSVDGLPLAIELAASWLKSLTCTEIVAEIQQSIHFLTTNISNIPQNHQSIQAVFDHSWHLCTADEQVVFRQLCVFRDGFTRESAEHITGAMLPVLSALVEKSMVRKLPSGRYELQELVRQYAEEQLKVVDQLEATQLAHMTYYAGFLGERTPDIKGRRQLEGLNEIKADFENVRVAWLFGIQQADYPVLDQMMEGLALYCDMHARYSEGHDLLKKAVDELASNDPIHINPVWNRMRVRWIQAWVLPELNVVPDVIRQQLDASLAFATAHDDRDTVGLCLWLRGELERISYNLLAVQPLYEQAMAYYEQLDDDYYVGRILRVIVYSLINFEVTRTEQTQKLNQQHIYITRSIGDRSGLAHALGYETHYENSAISVQNMQEAIAIWREMGDWKSVGAVSSLLSLNILLNGQFERARQLALEGEELQRISGWQHQAFENFISFGLNAVFREAIDAQQQLNAVDVAQIEKICGNNEKLELLTGLAYVMLALLNADKTEQHIQSALTLVHEPFVPLAAAGCLPPIAMILADEDEKEKAVQLLGLAFTYADHYLMGWMTHWQRLTRLREQLQAELGDEAFNRAWEQGAQLDLEDTIGELLVYFGGVPAAATPSANQALIEPLTERELEVLTWLVEGYSNPQIAEKLTVVVGTVKSHSSNIYGKLGVKNRTQAVLRAKQLGLI